MTPKSGPQTPNQVTAEMVVVMQQWAFALLPIWVMRKGENGRRIEGLALLLPGSPARFRRRVCQRQRPGDAIDGAKRHLGSLRRAVRFAFTRESSVGSDGSTGRIVALPTEQKHGALPSASCILRRPWLACGPGSGPACTLRSLRIIRTGHVATDQPQPQTAAGPARRGRSRISRHALRAISAARRTTGCHDACAPIRKPDGQTCSDDRCQTRCHDPGASADAGSGP